MTTFYIEHFGCRAASSPAAAEIVVVNTCTVTAAADVQARDAIRKIHKRNPSTSIVVTGCYAQRAPEELAALPGVSWVVGNSHKPQIPDLICEHSDKDAAPRGLNFVPAASLHTTEILLADTPFADERRDQSSRAQVLIGDASRQTHVLVAPVFGGEGNHTRPTLKIQDGCNSRCAFCVIPFVRGKSRSLPPDEILGEINRLSAAGFREIVLSGINLGTWGRDLTPRLEFIRLLERILAETSVERLRISSIEPMDVTRDLIELIASSERIAQHFHIPLQSGSDRILAAMHRWYRTEHYARRVELIHERLPNAAIGADVIAGFPGESEDDHAASLAFIERLPFAYLHVFSYSSRPGTRAASLPDHAPVHIIKRRARALRALAEAKANAFRASQIGRNVRVLTLHRGANDTDFTPALSANYLRVSVPGLWPPNRWLDVIVSDRAMGNRCVAELSPNACEFCAS